MTGPDWTFIGLIGSGSIIFGAVLGLMLYAALPHRADERARSDSEPT